MSVLDSALELSNFCYQNAGFTEGFRAERSHLDRAQCVAPAPPVVSTLSPLADSAVPTELVSRRVMRRHGWTMIGFSWCAACPFLMSWWVCLKIDYGAVCHKIANSIVNGENVGQHQT